MGRMKSYRRSARECLALADVVSNPADRAMLVAMAARWHDLAQQADRKSEAQAEENPHWARRARFRLVSSSKAPRPSRPTG